MERYQGIRNEEIFGLIIFMWLVPEDRRDEYWINTTDPCTNTLNRVICGIILKKKTVS